ncbi:MAG: sulfatase [Opitutaceae bacterium]|nr:sulfatase [Opitutaceae bacterium]
MFKWASSSRQPNRLIAFLGLACLAWSAHAAATSRPNFLLIIADDCTYSDLGVYGGQGRTPHLDRLAGEGMKFTRCFQAAAMCSPTRHALYTGLYPVKSGAYPNHTMAYEWVKSIASYLQPAGYRTYLSGKTHINPLSVFPFQYSARADDGNPDPEAFDRALTDAAKTGSPFLFIAASHEPHGPWDKGDPSKYPPASLQLPPIWADTPETREAFSRYLAEITYFDSQVGEFLGLLERHGQRDNTLVIVVSEQGNSFPFAKWTCYEAGLQSGCLVRWPGRIKSRAVSDALVEYVDVVPTFLEAAGLPRPDILDGRSFLPVLTGATRTHKTHVFGLQTSRGIVNGSDHYGIRSVRDTRYRYIRNFSAEVTFQNGATKGAVFRSWEKSASAGNKRAALLVHDYQHRPAEELYDCEADPWNRVNLINNPRLSPVRDALRTRLDAWMKQQGDEGDATEMKALERMPKRIQYTGALVPQGKKKTED